MTDQKELQEKLIRYQIINSRIKALSDRREFLLAKLLEIETTLNAIEEMEKSKGDEIFLPLGSGVHVPGTLKKTGSIIVELGADIAVKRTAENAKEILKKRKEILENGLRSIENEMMNLGDELSKLEPYIKAALERIKSSTEITAG